MIGRRTSHHTILVPSRARFLAGGRGFPACALLAILACAPSAARAESSATRASAAAQAGSAHATVKSAKVSHSFAAVTAREEGPPVVLLHGLALNSLWMRKLSAALSDSGFRTCAVDYPSREYPIDTLALRFVLPAVKRCFPNDTAVNFVTHSMGGILARALEQLPHAPAIGRVVMIAPPNRGSEVVDTLKGWWAFNAWNGPAGGQLGTDSNSIPNRLGPPRFEFGVIAANRSMEPLFSSWIPGDDDGKVAVEHTKLAGMRDFVEIPASHTMVLWKDETARQMVSFLRTGAFSRK